jgi:hypothetical protein
MEVPGMDAATQRLVDSIESAIVSGRATDDQAGRIFLAVIADRIEKLTAAVDRLRESTLRDRA